VKRWLAFRPQRLAFTRFDETSAPGAAPGVAAAAGLPVSFLSSGPRIPEDLELASAGRLLEMVVGNMNGGTARAAGAV
jgi:flagellar biosynthesis protein FlhF